MDALARTASALEEALIARPGALTSHLAALLATLLAIVLVGATIAGGALAKKADILFLLAVECCSVQPIMRLEHWQHQLLLPCFTR